MNSTLKILLSYLALGWRVLAVHSVRDGGSCTCFKSKDCDHPGKHPIFTGGCHSATGDEAKVRDWLDAKPWANWGIATGSASGLLVLDIDPRHGGNESLAILVNQHGPLPFTPTVKTGGGGTQYYFRHPAGSGLSSGSAILPGIDFRGNGGLVVAPPSNHKSGNHYEWVVPPETLLADAPNWLIELLTRRASSPTPSLQSSGDAGMVLTVRGDGHDLSGDGVAEGGRHNALCQRVGVHLSRGDSRPTVEVLAKRWGERCVPAMDESEVEKVVTDLWDKHHSGTDTPDEDDLGDEPSANGITLHSDAYYGLFGEMLRAAESQLEATPAGALLGWLTCFGNVIGRTAHFQVKGRPHHPCLFVVNVADTGDGKEDTWDVAIWPFLQLEPHWAGSRILGVGSGEGMVEQVGDPAEVDAAAPDKRLLIRLGELSRAFKIGRRDGSTFGELLLEAWDGKRLSIPNRKPNDLTATGYTISVFGDITPTVLRKVLATGMEGEDGTANRFLFNFVQPVRDLSDGGDINVLRPFLGRLADALAFAKTVGEVKRDGDADEVWKTLYGSLKRLPKVVPHTHRARPYVMRLALLYALADKSSVIRLSHLSAGLAVWRYCEESAKVLFGEVENIPPGIKPGAVERLAMRLLKPILVKPGVNKRELFKAVGNKPSKGEMNGALGLLHAHGLARSERTETDGRGCERWFPASDMDVMTEEPPVPIPTSEPLNLKLAVVKIEELPMPPNQSLEPPMTMTELFDAVRQRKGKLVNSNGTVQVIGVGEIPERMQTSIDEHQAMLQQFVQPVEEETEDEFMQRMRAIAEDREPRFRLFPEDDLIDGGGAAAAV